MAGVAQGGGGEVADQAAAAAGTHAQPLGPAALGKLLAAAPALASMHSCCRQKPGCGPDQARSLVTHLPCRDQHRSWCGHL